MTQNPKARITYRFDRSADGKRGIPVRQVQREPEGAAESERKIVRLYPEELQFADDVMPWKSPFQDDPYALERLIRETDALQYGGAGGRGVAGDSWETQPQAASAPRQAVSEEPAQDQAGGIRTSPEIVPLGLAEERIRADNGEASYEAVFYTVDEAGRQAGAGAAQIHPAANDSYSPYDGEAAYTTDAPDRTGAAYPGRSDDRSDGIETDPFGIGPNAYDSRWNAGGREGAPERPYTGYIAPRRRPAGPSWMRVFASVAGAVLTGALFGYLVLTLFADRTPVPADGAPVSGNEAAINDQTAGGVPITDGLGANAPAAYDAGSTTDEPSSGGQADGVQAVAVDIPARSYYMLQFGVFSGEEGLEAALGQLRSAGYAAAADRTDGYRVFAGIADSRVEADLLAEQLAGSETFVKEVNIPAASRIAYGGTPEEAEAFFAGTDALIRFMAERSTAMLAASKLEPFGDKTWTEWQALHRGWTEAAAALRQSNPISGDYETVIRAVGTAAAAFEAYKDNPSRSHMWTAQSALMEAVFAQKEWLGNF